MKYNHNFNDLTGQVFGRLTVLHLDGKNKHGRSRWKCQCICGKTKTVNSAELLKGDTTSCGCWHSERVRTSHTDLLGKHFGRWTVLSCSIDSHHKTMCLCKCDCGNEGQVKPTALRNGNSKSCGCYGTEIRRKAFTKHGLSRTLAYHMLKGAYNRAVKEGLPFNLELSDIAIPEFCPVFGVRLNTKAGQDRESAPSLDKIIPELGYVKGNIRVISGRANRIKNDGTWQEHLAIAEYIQKEKTSCLTF